MDNNIIPSEYYAASTIIRNGWFPWIKHISTFRRILMTEEGQATYKPVIRTAINRTFIKIKGEVILDIIKSANEGTLKL